jgi:hypothetical protein
MLCECGCGQEFEPKRPWQRFFSPACRRGFHNRQVVYRRPRDRARSHDNASKTHLTMDGSLPLPPGLYEENGEFSHARGVRASFPGQLYRIGLQNPGFALRLADAVRRDSRAEKPEEVFA